MLLRWSNRHNTV